MSRNTAVDRTEVIPGINVDDLKDALQDDVAQLQSVCSKSTPTVTGFAVIGSVADGTHTIGESDLDTVLLVDDRSVVNTKALQHHIIYGGESAGYGTATELVKPQLTHVDLGGVLDNTEDLDLLRDPFSLY